MRDIKKIAKEYRQQNGDNAITTKDLLWYLVAKIDKLEAQDIQHESKIARLDGVVSILFAVLIGLVVKVVCF